MDLFTSFSAWIHTLATTHPYWFAFAVVPLTLAMVNLGIWFFTSPRWDSILASNPRFAALCKLLDAMGISPVKALKAFYFLINGKPYEPPAPPAAGGGVVGIKRPFPLPPAAIVMIALGVSALGVTFGGVAFGGCAAFGGKPATVTSDVLKDAKCVVDHYPDLAEAEAKGGLEELAAQVASDCGIDGAMTVMDIFGHQKASFAKAAKAGLIGPSSSSSK